MNITVYLGAREGNDPCLATEVKKLGRWIGENGNTLIYGGSKVGLMGMLADSTLDAGGKVIGIEPEFFIQEEVQHNGLTELIVTKDMAERKAKLVELGDAFITFPGGTGTLEEIAEVMSRLALGKLHARSVIYNLNGYYEGLRMQLRHMVEMDLSTDERLSSVYFADSLDQIREIIERS